MAIIRQCKDPNGAIIIIRDDAYRDASPEEIRRRRQHIRETVARVDLDNQRRELERLAREAAEQRRQNP